MKNYSYFDQEDNREMLKVTEEEPFKSQYDEDLEAFDRKTKRLKAIALSVLLSGVIALNAYGIVKNIQNTSQNADTDYNISYNYDKNDCVDPEIVTRYVAPAGYTLGSRDGEPIGIKVEKTMISPSVVTEYHAPEGYVMVGDKCFKLLTSEKSKGR